MPRLHCMLLIHNEFKCQFFSGVSKKGWYPPSPLISTNSVTRIAVIWLNFPSQLHSHLSGILQNPETMHPSSTSSTSYQTPSHLATSRCLSDISCNTEWRSWCSSWRLAIQANKVMPLKSARFMGILKIPGEGSQPEIPDDFKDQKRAPKSPPCVCTFGTSEYCTEDIAENAWWKARRYMTRWSCPGMNWCAVWCCINVNICINFLTCVTTNLKLILILIISWHSHSKSCLANGNESRNLSYPIRSAVLNGACNLARDQITPANVHEEVWPWEGWPLCQRVPDSSM